MTLFDQQREQRLAKEAPLAARMRPIIFDNLLGQDHIVGPDRILRQAIEIDRIPSIILWGPPGSGKTTLALLIASRTLSHFNKLSAVTSGVADLRSIIEAARDRLGMHGQRTILFVDEIHRFNKAQQDVILPHVEDGTIIFIGATTENPSFEVIAPLLSRCRVFSLNPLTEKQISTIIERALTEDQTLASTRVALTEKAKQILIATANGDARVALNTLDFAAAAIPADPDGDRTITTRIMKDILQHQALRYDKAGDLHYDHVSAYIKSVRASDADAAIYWLARMLESGEDPLFITRRMVILAAEDIGMADPYALTIAVAAQQAIHFIGMPEGRIPLAEATVYLATAPKSNSTYAALSKAIEDIRNGSNEPVPLHLRNAQTRLMREMGYGHDYKYAHNYPEHFARQSNLPENIKNRSYYQPSCQGYEHEISERITKWWGKRKDDRTPESHNTVSGQQ
ncbi:MAG: AAA family ATPase [SAR202 cluster bacterium Io17-Chloro-G3]|nr:MAG: AAA family ATPase [SAR202 cluster bacterium Io17-Chloro-G3]